MPTIAIVGTLDTKAPEHAFVAEQIQLRGHQTLVIDVGTLGEPGLRPDVTRAERKVTSVTTDSITRTRSEICAASSRASDAASA